MLHTVATLGRVFADLEPFVEPVEFVQAPGDAARWFVAERRGTIWAFDHVPTTTTRSTFLDLRAETNAEVHDHLGLQAIAFHPDFAVNGHVFVHYTSDSTTAVAASQVVRNQLATYDQIGLFSAPLGTTPDLIDAYPDPYDLTGDLELRTRSCLHTNCSHGHRPSGPGLGVMDYRYTAPASALGCGAAPTQGGPPGALIVDPGASSHSITHIRLTTESKLRMPPLTPVPYDAAGASVITDWIDGLTACPP